MSFEYTNNFLKLISLELLHTLLIFFFFLKIFKTPPKTIIEGVLRPETNKKKHFKTNGENIYFL